jgi:glycosyltransferase involved in cell wall biosynthesis
VHLPQFFPPRERVKRDVMLRSFCKQARVVSVTSSWVKRDLMRQYGLPDEKVAVVPLTGALGAYPTPSDDDIVAARRKFNLPEAFAFYPAQTWPHKNHAALLEALAVLRDRHGVVVPLVSSGHQNEYFATLQKRVAELRLAEQVRFVGFVSPLELQCLYRVCRCVVIPTLFEAASGPLNEAFMAGAAAACSNVTSLPEQAGESALVFDPNKADEIAAAILRLWHDETLRRTLIERGRANVARFTWDRTARHLRAWYRRLGGRPLTDQDRAMLEAAPLI